MNYPLLLLLVYIFCYPIFWKKKEEFFGFTKHKNQIDKTIFAAC